MNRNLSLVRILALAGLGFYTAELLGNVIQTWDTFNPSYWGYYVQQQLARPLVGIAIALLFWFAARPIARRLSRDSED
jgi:hypothetical protein